MSEKSHAGMEIRICEICCEQYETGAILLHRQLKKELDTYQVTGMGRCEECSRKIEKGMTALVEIDLEKSGAKEGDRMSPRDVYRTGRMAFAFLSDEFPYAVESDLIFVEEGTIDYLSSQIATEN